MKPTLFQYFWKNTKWVIAFLFGTNLLFYLLLRQGRFDIDSFRFWFWLTVAIFIISVIGTMIHYNKTFRK
jgi:hypothetical protein